MLPLLLTGLLLAPQDPATRDHELAEGPHCAVLCHWRSVRLGAELPRQVVDAVERAWALAAVAYGLEELPGQVVVNVYEDRKAYVQAEQGVAGGEFKDDWAFAFDAGGEVHVTQQPVLTDKVLEFVGVPPRVLRRAAEEAVALGLRAQGHGGAAASDAWVHAAVARVAAQRALVALSRDAPGTEAPCVSQSAWLLRARRARGTLPPLAAALAGEAGLSADERAALQLMLGERLLHGADTAASASARLAQGGAGVGAALLALLGDDPDAAFGAWLDGLALPFNEVSGSMARTDLGWLQASAAGESGVCFRTQPVGRQEYELVGELMLLPGAKGVAQMNLLFGRLGDDYLSVAFNAAGGVTVFGFDADGGEDGAGLYTELVAQRGVQLLVEQPIPFRLAVRDGRGFLEVAGVDVPPFSLEGRDMSGAFGYGAQRGRIGVWFSLELL
jgi:hypothetical protein